MALTMTLTAKHAWVNGDRREQVVDATFDTYPTGGYALNYNTANVGLFARIDFVTVDGGNGYRVQYNYSTNKLMFFTSAGTETSNTTDVSAVTARLRIVGK